MRASLSRHIDSNPVSGGGGGGGLFDKAFSLVEVAH